MIASHISFLKDRQRNESGLSCAFLAGSTKKTPDCLAGYAIRSGNLAKRFVMLTHTAYHIRPFFRWDAIVRLTWTWMLLVGDDLGNTAQYLLEGEQSVIELTVRGHKVN
jgi:hypothetical protein